MRLRATGSIRISCHAHLVSTTPLSDCFNEDSPAQLSAPSFTLGNFSAQRLRKWSSHFWPRCHAPGYFFLPIALNDGTISAPIPDGTLAPGIVRHPDSVHACFAPRMLHYAFPDAFANTVTVCERIGCPSDVRPRSPTAHHLLPSPPSTRRRLDSPPLFLPSGDESDEFPENPMDGAPVNQNIPLPVAGPIGTGRHLRGLHSRQRPMPRVASPEFTYQSAFERDLQRAIANSLLDLVHDRSPSSPGSAIGQPSTSRLPLPSTSAVSSFGSAAPPSPHRPAPLSGRQSPDIVAWHYMDDDEDDDYRRALQLSLQDVQPRSTTSPPTSPSRSFRRASPVAAVAAVAAFPSIAAIASVVLLHLAFPGHIPFFFPSFFF
ncbi:hypothetical protein HDZ31DRAFT_70154 [Schizophyllum fasciatum]